MSPARRPLYFSLFVRDGLVAKHQVYYDYCRYGDGVPKQPVPGGAKAAYDIVAEHLELVAYADKSEERGANKPYDDRFELPVNAGNRNSGNEQRRHHPTFFQCKDAARKQVAAGQPGHKLFGQGGSFGAHARTCERTQHQRG